ncbi:EamA family transporter [Microbacterium suaedae]|uniref:EamA family transporter n=1 Tax=Microbacterium suaedae TaxID=2067813 RepID=UPI000DAD59AE|nr:EamA family transporter [Microbacterium suaedae]
MTREHRVGVAAVATTGVLWGTTGTAATFAPEAGPLAIGSAALGIGGILQALIALRPLRAALPALRERLGLVVLGAVSVAIYPLAFYASMHLAGVAIGSVVSLASAPLASGVIDRVVDRSRLGRGWAVAAALGIAGGVLLCAEKASGGDPAASTLLGIVLGLCAGVSYATYSWVVQRLIGGGISRAAAMGAVFGAGGVLLLPVLAVTGAPLVASGTAFAVAAYMALVPMFLGYVLFGIGLARIPARSATTITLIEPAVAAVLAVLIVGERFGVGGWIGLGLVAAALVVVALAPAGHGSSNERILLTQTEGERWTASTR